jgi:hypothetical protein
MRRQLVALVLLLGCLVASPQAEAKLLRSYKIGNWLIGVYGHPRSGAFSNCIATASYKNGITLGFVVSRDLRWKIAFSDPRWNLTAGKEVNGAYRVDEGNVRATTAFAIGPNAIQAELPDRADIFDEFRRGRMLSFTGGGDVVQFALTDTSRMLADLLQCARDRGAPPSRPDMLRQASVPPPAAAPPPAAGPTAETRLEATLLATNVLNSLGGAPFEMLERDALPAELRQHDAVWRTAGGMLGSLRVLADGRASTSAQIKADLLATDSFACKGKFLSGVVPSEHDTSDDFNMFTVCDSGAGVTVTYILARRPKGGHYLFSLRGTRDEGEAVRSSGSDFRLAAHKVLGR